MLPYLFSHTYYIEMEKWLKFSLIIICCFSFFACKQMSNDAPKVLVDQKNENLPTEEIVSSKARSDSYTEKKTIIDYDQNQWQEIIATDDMTVIDLKYASKDNFTKQQIYDCPRCFLRPVVSEKLTEFKKHMLEKFELGIILYDCYRPRPAQQKLWDIVPDEKYVGNPAKGSMHNRGMAIDIGLIDREGKVLDMGTPFDHFGVESFHSATNISKEAIANRKMLKNEIGLFGFKPITSEWWHYSYREDIGELSNWEWSCDENAN